MSLPSRVNFFMCPFVSHYSFLDINDLNSGHRLNLVDRRGKLCPSTMKILSPYYPLYTIEIQDQQCQNIFV